MTKYAVRLPRPCKTHCFVHQVQTVYDSCRTVQDRSTHWPSVTTPGPGPHCGGGPSLILQTVNPNQMAHISLQSKNNPSRPHLALECPPDRYLTVCVSHFFLIQVNMSTILFKPVETMMLSVSLRTMFKPCCYTVALSQVTRTCTATGIPILTGSKLKTHPVRCNIAYVAQ